MRWSKLKALTEERFAPSVAGRVEIFSTRYGDCSCGRAWITVDGREVASFCTRAAALGSARGVVPRRGKLGHGKLGHGELSRQDAYAACWAFVHDLSIGAALGDSDPLVQTLAVLDRRVGRRRLDALDATRLHPLAQELLRVRRAAEARGQTREHGRGPGRRGSADLEVAP